MKRLMTSLLFLLLTGLLFGQNPMGVVHIGGFDNTTYQFDYNDTFGMKGDTLVISRPSLNERHYQIEQFKIFPDGSIQPFTQVFSLNIPDEYGEILPYNRLYFEYKNGKFYFAVITQHHILIILEDNNTFSLHDIDTTPVDFEGSHFITLYIQDENFAYFTKRQYPMTDISSRSCKINLNTNQAEILIEQPVEMYIQPYHFQSIGDYTLAYHYLADSGYDMLIHNGSIVQYLNGPWGNFTVGYGSIQNFCNHYNFMIEYDGIYYQKSLIAWVENDSLKRFGISSSMLEGDPVDTFNGIHSIDDSHFLTHFTGIYPYTNKFRTYQINLLNNVNQLEDCQVFPDLSAYGQAVALLPLSNDYVLALSRTDDPGIQFNLVDFTDQSIRTYPFVFDYSSSYNPGRMFHSDNLVYFLYGQRINIFKLERIQSGDDMTNPPIVEQTQVYPNPFRNECQINIKTSANSNSEISIYNIKGQKIRTFDLSLKANTDNLINWDGKNAQNQNVASGIYFVKVKSNQQFITKKILKLR